MRKGGGTAWMRFRQKLRDAPPLGHNKGLAYTRYGKEKNLPAKEEDPAHDYSRPIARREALDFYQMVTRGTLSAEKAREDIKPAEQVPDDPEGPVLLRVRQYRGWVTEEFEALVANGQPLTSASRTSELDVDLNELAPFLRKA